MLGGVGDVFVISTREDTNRFEKLLGNGENLDMSIKYAVQDPPDGISQAFIIGESFTGDDQCMLILGDNLFFGNELQAYLVRALKNVKGATIFGYPVNYPERYGVVEYDKQDRVISIEEKPTKPKSRYSVTGLYIYNNRVIEITKNITPSKRGELEITSLNNSYLESNSLHLEVFGRGMTWLDARTPSSLMEAAEFVKVIQNRQGLIVSSPEEMAWRNGWIGDDQLIRLSLLYGNSDYRNYPGSLVIGFNEL